MGAKLNVKQWVVASLAVFVVLSILVFLGTKITEGMFPDLTVRPETMQDMTMPRIWNYLGRILFSLVFVFVYTKGLEDKPGLAQGMRFGLWIGLLINVPSFFGGLVTSSWPTSFLAFNGFLGIVFALVAGITTGMTYKKLPQG
jgi:hypothetical protein